MSHRSVAVRLRAALRPNRRLRSFPRAIPAAAITGVPEGPILVLGVAAKAEGAVRFWTALRNRPSLNPTRTIEIRSCSTSVLLRSKMTALHFTTPLIAQKSWLTSICIGEPIRYGVIIASCLLELAELCSPVTLRRSWNTAPGISILMACQRGHSKRLRLASRREPMKQLLPKLVKQLLLKLPQIHFKAPPPT